MDGISFIERVDRKTLGVTTAVQPVTTAGFGAGRERRGMPDVEQHRNWLSA
jgi:hypothetical protein